MGFNVVVVESDSRVTNSLSSHFHSVLLTRPGDDLRERVAKSRPEAVILDMEYSRLTDVRNLRQDFPSLPIVCTHRVPDEELWIAAMDAGASDVCAPDDVQNVLTSTLRSVPGTRSAVA
jgi:DNA-binding NarL/FixJ family response regulator